MTDRERAFGDRLIVLFADFDFRKPGLVLLVDRDGRRIDVAGGETLRLIRLRGIGSERGGFLPSGAVCLIAGFASHRAWI